MDGARLFLVVHSIRTRSSGLKLEHRKFHPSKGDGALKWAAQRGCGVVFYGNIQDLSGCLSATYCRVLALLRSWTL